MNNKERRLWLLTVWSVLDKRWPDDIPLMVVRKQKWHYEKRWWDKILPAATILLVTATVVTAWLTLWRRG